MDETGQRWQRLEVPAFDDSGFVNANDMVAFATATAYVEGRPVSVTAALQPGESATAAMFYDTETGGKLLQLVDSEGVVRAVKAIPSAEQLAEWFPPRGWTAEELRQDAVWESWGDDN